MDPAALAAFAAHFQPHLQPPPPPQQPPFTTVDVHPTPMPNPTLNLPQPVPSHPSYQEMITAAILWDNSQGKEGGSSKRAIEKYISRVYSNLPPTHSALLTHHLKRLKHSAQLVMIKNSYQLPSFLPPAPPPPLRSETPPPPPPPPSTAALFRQPPPVVPAPVNNNNIINNNNNLATPKRKPGRPAKPKPELQAQAQPHLQVQVQQPVSVPNASAVVVNGGSLGKRPRGRPPRNQNQNQNQSQQQVVVPFVQPVAEVVSNGQVEVSAPKRRGRPPRKQPAIQLKQEAAAASQPVFQVEVERVVPEVVQAQATHVNGVEVLKRRPGRPAKVKPTAAVGVGIGVGMGVGRGRGRPKKGSVVQKINNVVKALAPVSDTVGKKKRGWPRGKPRGKKGGAGAGAVIVARHPGVKRRGRKPKGSVVEAVAAKVYTGKPRGRPRKNSVLVKNTSPQEPDAVNEDLRRKLEDMQSKIRDAVGVIRSHVTNQNSADALTALQQLEDLSTLNGTASASLTAPPVMAVPMNVAAPPSSTSAPESFTAGGPTLTAPSMMTFTAPPGMSVPISMSMNVPSMTVTAPLHAPSSSEHQQPMGWIPFNEAQS